MMERGTASSSRNASGRFFPCFHSASATEARAKKRHAPRTELSHAHQIDDFALAFGGVAEVAVLPGREAVFGQEIVDLLQPVRSLQSRVVHVPASGLGGKEPVF